MTLLHAFLLGIVQGLTEFIPVSSTAHLLISQTIFNIPADDAMFSFLVIVQLGTLVSLFALYWKDLVSIARATLDFRSLREALRRSKNFGSLESEAKLGWYIIVATIPALLAGYLLKDAVQMLFRQPMLQASIRLFAAAILLTLAEALTKKNRSLASMSWLDALIVGAFQIIAVFPGASRSGATISGGMFRGFDRPSAARFAFLMSVPVMIAAGGYESIQVILLPNTTEFLPILMTGFVSSAIVGWFAIRWLLAYLRNHSLYVFAIYCAIAGLLCILSWAL
jgi:undecaprenyl-diphosphatase